MDSAASRQTLPRGPARTRHQETPAGGLGLGAFTGVEGHSRKTQISFCAIQRAAKSEPSICQRGLGMLESAPVTRGRLFYLHVVHR